MLDGFLRSGRGRTSRKVWVPPAPPGGGSLGPGVNEPAGMTAVIQANFTTLPPLMPAAPDAQGFAVNTSGGGANPQLTIVTDGADTMLRGTIPAAKQQVGNSDWWLVSGAIPANTGKFYSRQRVRFSANWRLDSAFRIKFMSLKTVGTNNHLMLSRNTPASGAKDPVGQGQSMAWTFLTQAGGAVGSIQYGAAPNFLIVPDGGWHDLEYVITPGTAGSANSSMQIWWDGNLMWTQSGIIMQNVGLSHSVTSLDAFFNPSTLSPNPGHMNTTDGSGNIGTAWQDQTFDYDWWYASVETV